MIIQDSTLTLKETLMNSLALTSYIGINETSGESISQEITPFLKTLSQELLWGPAIHLQGNKADALMMIVQNVETEEYTIVIRGTNPFSLNCWITQDLAVAPPLCTWTSIIQGKLEKKKSIAINEAAISRGAAKTLQLLRNLKPEQGLPGQGQYFWQFMEPILNQSPVINFTGHSLGGLAAPTLALWCIDKFSSWNQNSAQVYVYPFAGPTAGNETFVHHSDSTFCDTLSPRCIRITGEKDLVPLAFHDILKVKNLYEPIQKTPKSIQFLADSLNSQVGSLYTQLSIQKTLISQLLSLPDEEKDPILALLFFGLQAAYQHIIPYLEASFFEKDKKIALFTMLYEAYGFSTKEKSLLKAQFDRIIDSITE